MALVGQPALGNLLETLGEQIGFDAAMRFDHADHGIHAVQPTLTALQQHLIRLADAGCCAEKNLEATATFFSRLAKQRFGRWAIFAVRAVLSHAASLRPSQLSSTISAPH